MTTKSDAINEERAPQLTLIDRINIIKNHRFFPIIFPLTMLVVLFLLFVVLTGGKFLKASVITGIFNQSLIIGTLATGVAFIYTTGNIDFSVGAVMGLACVIGAMAYQATNSMLVLILVTALCGIGIMMINCTLGVVFKIMPAMTFSTPVSCSAEPT